MGGWQTKKLFCWAMLAGIFLGLFSFGAPGASAQSTPPPSGFLRVMRPDVTIQIDSPPLTFATGQHLPLFQENERYFVALLEPEEKNSGELPSLCAFRVAQMGVRRAWVTREALMFFAYQTSTTRGHLVLEEGEELPVLRENKDGYEVIAERFERKARLWIPRRTKNIQYVDIPPRPMIPPPPPPPPPIDTEFKSRGTNGIIGIVQVGGQTLFIYKDESSAVTVADVSTLSARIGRIMPFFQSKPVSENPAPAKLAPVKTDDGFSSPAPAPHPSIKPSPSPAPLLPQPPPPQASSEPQAKPEPRPKPVPPTGQQPFEAPLLLLCLLAGVTLFAFFYNWRQRRSKQRLSKKAAILTAEKPPPPPPPKPPREHASDLSGALSSMPMGSLAQLLNSERETGVLTIMNDKKIPIGTMIFIKGELIDARTDQQRGPDAVYAIVRNRVGTFSFKRGPGIGSQRTIKQATMPLILDAYRMVDEQGA